MKSLALPILFFALICTFALTKSKVQRDSVIQQEVSLIESPKKASIRPKEQDKFIQSFLESEKAEEAWGLFSYGGFTDAGQFKVFKQKKSIQIYFSSPQAMSGKKSARDGSIIYREFLLDKKDPAWKDFEKTLSSLESDLEEFQITHFDAFQFDFLHLTKSKNKVNVRRVYFDDPYLRKKKTQNLQKLLRAFDELVEKIKK